MITLNDKIVKVTLGETPINRLLLGLKEIYIDYTRAYLTFRILTNGTIQWMSRNNVSKTISYSNDMGQTWTEITATVKDTFINVSAGDILLFKGTNTTYATAKDACSCFRGSALFTVEGNIMSLVGGDNFQELDSLNNVAWVFHDIFAGSNVVSAKHLILPAKVMTAHCYRAMFSKALYLEEAPELPSTSLADSCYKYMFDVTKVHEAPELPATTLAQNCYEGMFENCLRLTRAPELPALTLKTSCYLGIFRGCKNLSYIKCLATNTTASNCVNEWVKYITNSGQFVKNSSKTWGSGNNGIPSGWSVYNEDEFVENPIIKSDGYNNITLECPTEGANIHYKLNNAQDFTTYTTPIELNEDTKITTYAIKSGQLSSVITYDYKYLSLTPIDYSNRDLTNWKYLGSTITTPYSINATDGHTNNYAKVSNSVFNTDIILREVQPTYLWFQHADQSADIYVNGDRVDTHWGGYNAFFSDISKRVRKGVNHIEVVLNNNTRGIIAPIAGDFNYNATLGNVKLFTSPVLPDKSYGYDGFHVTADVNSQSATINVKTKIPSGGFVKCIINDGNTNVFTKSQKSIGDELTFTTTINNPHLWNGTIDPHLYDIILEVYKDGKLYHRYVRPYGLRYYQYVFNEDITVNGETINAYSGFLLNGAPYLLRGVCMHDDIANKANALSNSDYTQEFNIIQELNCNFIRLAHYPHPKEVYDRCDALGIIVETEIPWVNESRIDEEVDYWNNLTHQCEDMVNQHYNHPCIIFWGVGNELNSGYTNSTEGKNFVKSKIEGFRNTIRTILPGAWVGYVVSHGVSNPTGVFNNPTVDWVGGNIYVGWYIEQTSNNPSSQLNIRLNNENAVGVPYAFSEYGAGGTQKCHSDDPQTTTTKGTGKSRHDIEYQMWIHEGHIATIKNYPQLLFAAQWVLFDFAVSSRAEGYIVCESGISTSTDNNLKYLNNKGLVQRDHTTKKDTFYLYKAWWNKTDKFVNICGKNYYNNYSRVIKCYTNDGDTLTMYINGTAVETVSVTDNIATFTARDFVKNDVVMVQGATANDSFTFTRVIVYTTGVSLNYSELTLSKGSNKTLTATVTPSDATQKSCNWTTSDSSVATVTSAGKVTAVNYGEATITVTTVDGGYTAQCIVTVPEE